MRAHLIVRPAGSQWRGDIHRLGGGGELLGRGPTCATPEGARRFATLHATSLRHEVELVTVDRAAAR